MTVGGVAHEWAGAASEVLVIRLDRPHRANAYVQETLVEMERLIHEAAASSVVRAAIVTGTGTTFCSGADLSEIAARHQSEPLSLLSRDVFNRWAEMPWPTIAVINGPAVGGGFELGLACDFRLCSPNAIFRFPENDLGLVPGAGGIRRLIAEVGASRAKELLLLGRTLDAATARDWGLVSHVDEQPLELALHFVSSIIRRDRVSLAATKLLLADQLEASRGVGAEAVVQALLYGRRERSTAI